MRRAISSTATLLAAFTALPAMAHTGTETASLFAGLLHPFTGVDHLLAMFAVGLWLMLQNKQQQRTVAPAFVTMLLAGFVMALNGFGLPLLESGIAASVLIMGLLICASCKLPTTFALPLVATFALLHGFAHGAETNGAVALLFAAGFIFSSIVLMVTGAASTCLMRQHPRVFNRIIGVAIAMTGASLLAA